MSDTTLEKREVLRFSILTVLILVITPGMALGDNVIVDGEERNFYEDDYIDNLLVINGGRALLWGTTVSGNVNVKDEDSYLGLSGALVGGSVSINDLGRLSMGWSTIEGNLTGAGYLYINFSFSDVMGNIQLTEGGFFTAAYGSCNIGGNFSCKNGSGTNFSGFKVGGNVQVTNNVGAEHILIKDCEIDGNLSVVDNKMGQYITIKNNTIATNMMVKNNTPIPTVEGNIVGGKTHVD